MTSWLSLILREFTVKGKWLKTDRGICKNAFNRCSAWKIYKSCFLNHHLLCVDVLLQVDDRKHVLVEQILVLHLFCHLSEKVGNDLDLKGYICAFVFVFKTHLSSLSCSSRAWSRWSSLGGTASSSSITWGGHLANHLVVQFLSQLEKGLVDWIGPKLFGIVKANRKTNLYFHLKILQNFFVGFENTCSGAAPSFILATLKFQTGIKNILSTVSFDHPLNI